MSNEGAQALIGIIILLFVFAIILTPIIALWVYIILQNGKRKRIRERILAAHADVIGKKRWFSARYAGQQRFDSFFKILPWEGAGIFVVAPGSVLYLGEMLNGTPVTLQFAPGNSRVNCSVTGVHATIRAGKFSPQLAGQVSLAEWRRVVAAI